jgi:small subunit ribosomal protein S17
MAETPEETTETNVEEVETPATPASADEVGRGGERSETVPATPDAAASEETPAEATKPAAATGTRKERTAAARKAKAKPASGPRTLEDRLEERKAHRANNARQRTAYRAKQKVKRAEARAAAPVVEEQHAPEHGPGKPKVRQGIVISDKGEKTITVRIDTARRHKRYHKILRSSTTLHVHDESNDAHAGDTVRVQECRPMSRLKRWRLLEVLERAR